MSYIGNEPIVSATRTITEVTATAGQTVFTANGGYTVGYIDVFLNGAQLQTVDFTATNGTTITLTEAAQVGDVLKLVAWGTFSTATHVPLTGDSNITGNINVSGNLGVGTTNPSYKLEVGTTSDATTFVNIKSSTSGTSGVFFSDTNNGQGGIRYSHASDFMRFDTNDAERMRIDSSGCVTMPSQPMFFANKTTSTGLTATEVQPIYNNVSTNRGSCYNSANGRFTAPVSGVYQFNITNAFTSSNNNVYNAAYPWVNGASGTYSYIRIRGTPVNGSYGGINGSFCVYLSANDYIQMTFYSQFSGLALSANEQTFSGFLIG